MAYHIEFRGRYADLCTAIDTSFTGIPGTGDSGDGYRNSVT